MTPPRTRPATAGLLVCAPTTRSLATAGCPHPPSARDAARSDVIARTPGWGRVLS